MPYPVYLHHQDEEELVNTPSPVWLDPKATRKELLDYGAKVFQSSALDVFGYGLKAVGWRECFMCCLSGRSFLCVTLTKCI